MRGVPALPMRGLPGLGRAVQGKGARAGGALALLAALFAASAGVRAANPEGALAREAAELQNGHETTAHARPPHCPPTAAPNALLEAVMEREAQLDARADEIASRARVLEVSEARFREQEEALRDAERRLTDTVAIADQAAEADVASLVEVYEAMNPKNAAQVFEAMDVVFAAGFIARMQRDAAAQVMSGLSAEKAYAVSVVIAGRNATAPTE